MKKLVSSVALSLAMQLSTMQEKITMQSRDGSYRTLKHQDWLVNAAINIELIPRGKMITTGCNAINVWDLAKDTPINIMRDLHGRITCAKMISDNNIATTKTTSLVVTIQDLQGNVIRSFFGPWAVLGHSICKLNNHEFAVGGSEQNNNPSLVVFDQRSPGQKPSIRMRPRDSLEKDITALECLDEKHLLAGHWNNAPEITLWDIRKPEREQGGFTTQGSPHSIAVLGKTEQHPLITSVENDSFQHRILNLKGEIVAKYTTLSPNKVVTSLEFNKAFATGGDNGDLSLFTRRGALLALLKGHTTRVQDITELPHGDVLSADLDGYIKFWKFPSQESKDKEKDLEDTFFSGIETVVEMAEDFAIDMLDDI